MFFSVIMQIRPIQIQQGQFSIDDVIWWVPVKTVEANA